MLFRTQRKLYHSFQELVGRQADEVAEDELLGIKADKIAQLERLVARGVNEIPVAIVDDNDMPHGVESGAPRLSWSALKGIAGKAL